MKVTCTDLATVGRIPHGISVLATLFLFFGVLIFLVYVSCAACYGFAVCIISRATSARAALF
jgi:hypothetical protein